MERTAGETERAMHGTVIDYLYPLLGHGGRMDAKTLQCLAPHPGPEARDDIRLLTAEGYLDPVPAGEAHLLETRGFERVQQRTGEAVATEPAAYTLGPTGERYVAERGLSFLEDSLTYLFDR